MQGAESAVRQSLIDPVAASAPASAAGDSALDGCIDRATGALLAEQRRDGHWVFELEADATIPAEYVLLKRYLGEADAGARSARSATYLRRIQGAHGGWPLFHDGPFNISASVKAYFALKVIGDPPDGAAHAPRRAMRSSPTAAPGRPTSSRASCSRCTASFRGRRCRRFPSRSCTCRAGFRSTCSAFRTGAARCWRRCWCCRR